MVRWFSLIVHALVHVMPYTTECSLNTGTILVIQCNSILYNKMQYNTIQCNTIVMHMNSY